MTECCVWINLTKGERGFIHDCCSTLISVKFRYESQHLWEILELCFTSKALILLFCWGDQSLVFCAIYCIGSLLNIPQAALVFI